MGHEYSIARTNPVDINQKPDPALIYLEVLVGKWELTGRTLDSDIDNITGQVSFEWTPGGFFLRSDAAFDVNGFPLTTTEIIWYDPEQKIYPATVYTSLAGVPVPHWWDIQGKTVLHAGLGTHYEGLISADGNTITGSWRPDAGQPVSDTSAYDAILTRVK